MLWGMAPGGGVLSHQITLTQGKVAWVDDVDYERVSDLCECERICVLIESPRGHQIDLCRECLIRAASALSSTVPSNAEVGR